jgi:CelD/BcsL family acetyltransferase involved in cellulose biosynthesis
MVKSSSAADGVEVVDRSGFLALEREWNELVVTTQDEPFYRHEFLRVWMTHFNPATRLEVLTSRDRAGKLAAVFPLMRTRGFICGLPARLSTSIGNAHSCRFDMVAEDGSAAGKRFFAHLAADKSWDVLRIADVPDGGNAWHLYRAAEQAGFPVGVWESQNSPYLPLPPSYDALLSGMSTGFKANLRRRRRRLEAMGEVRVEHVTGGADLQARLDEGFAIERSGWKGKKGTAISQDAKTYGFYSELAHTAAARGYLSLFFLTLNGRSIAFQYGLTYGGVCYVPKLGYDEAYKDCSPGLLLMEESIKNCIARGVKGFDFLGLPGGWKTRWSRQMRRHNWLYIFRDSRFGQTLQTTKFRLLPAAKRVLPAAKRVLWPWRGSLASDS